MVKMFDDPPKGVAGSDTALDPQGKHNFPHSTSGIKWEPSLLWSCPGSFLCGIQYMFATFQAVAA